MTPKTKILLVLSNIKTKQDSWIQKDIDVLSRHYQVKVVEYPGNRKIYRLLKDYVWADLYFSWFGYKHSAISALIARFLGRKSIVIAGGYDAVKMPEITYGLMADPKKKQWAERAFRYSHRVLAVSESIKEDVIENCQKLQILFFANYSLLMVVFLSLKIA